MKKITWRLSKLPTPDEVRELVKDKIITQEEAREILFSAKEDSEPEPDALKSEIDFLRKLVEKLSNGNKTVITEHIYKYVPNYIGQWTQPYINWCSTGITNAVYTSGSNNELIGLNQISASYDISQQCSTTGDKCFSSIQTF